VRALAETLRFNTTLESLNLWGNGLGEGGGRVLAETLRPNTTPHGVVLGRSVSACFVARPPLLADRTFPEPRDCLPDCAGQLTGTDGN
jgi:hypothetical protein